MTLFAWAVVLVMILFLGFMFVLFLGWALTEEEDHRLASLRRSENEQR